MQDEPSQTQLQPLKLILHGPPASGKTKLAHKLCQRYGAHYVSVKNMIEETLDELQQNIDREKARIREKKSTRSEILGEEEEEESEEEDDEPLGDIEFWQEQFKDIHNLMAKSEDGKLPDEYVVKMMRDFLLKDVCQIKGYVLDGFPKTIEQAKELFGQAAVQPANYEENIAAAIAEGEDYVPSENTQIGNMIGNASRKIMPLFVVSLQAYDDVLCERVMNMPQREIQGTHFDEVNMLRRLAEFRRNNNEDNTVLRFFDEANIHPILINLEDDVGVVKSLDDIFEYIVSIVGPAIPGFGLSPEEEEEIRRLEEEQRRLQEETDRIERQMLEEKTKKEYEEKMEQWAETFQKFQKEEEKLLAAQSEPLRQYLMKYIFPTLSKGLIEVAKIKPEDPVDFLAEFLFKENPEGRMFDPSYTREGEKILEDYDKNLKQVRKESSSN